MVPGGGPRYRPSRRCGVPTSSAPTMSVSCSKSAYNRDPVGAELAREEALKNGAECHSCEVFHPLADSAAPRKSFSRFQPSPPPYQPGFSPSRTDNEHLNPSLNSCPCKPPTPS